MAADINIIPDESVIFFTSSTGNFNAVIQDPDGTIKFTGKTAYSGTSTFYSASTNNTNQSILTLNSTTKVLETRDLKTIINREWKEITGTTYTTVAGDETKWLRCTSATNCRIDYDSTVFADGDEIIVTQYGAGQVAIVGDSIGLPTTTTIESPTGFATTREQYATIFGKLLKTPKVLVLGGELEDRSPYGEEIITPQTTTSTSYTDLTTVGPSATVNIGPKGTAIVMLTAQAMTNSNGVECYMGFSVSGATTVSANDDQALASATRNSGDLPKSSAVFWVTGLNEGSNTFISKYRTTSGTATFADRNLVVIPVN
jgi:hypothetical protein